MFHKLRQQTIVVILVLTGLAAQGSAQSDYQFSGGSLNIGSTSSNLWVVNGQDLNWNKDLEEIFPTPTDWVNGNNAIFGDSQNLGRTLRAITVSNAAGAINLNAGSMTVSNNNNGSYVFSGSSITGAGLMITGSAGVTFHNSVSFGTATVSAASALRIGNSGTNGQFMGNVNLANANSSIVFDRSDSLIYGSVVSGSGSLTKLGLGLLTLTTAQNYGGGTNVNFGTLKVDAGASVGSGTVNVASGAALHSDASLNNVLSLAAGSTLSGSGTFNTTVDLSGVNVNPGTSPGTLTLGGLVANSATAFNFEMNGSNQTVGASINDLIQVNGNLTLDGIVNITAPVIPFTSAGSWRLFNYTGNLTNNGLTIGSIPVLAGHSFNIDISTSGQVNLRLITAVPEPSSFALLGLATSGLLFRRRKS